MFGNNKSHLFGDHDMTYFYIVIYLVCDVYMIKHSMIGKNIP